MRMILTVVTIQITIVSKILCTQTSLLMKHSLVHSTEYLIIDDYPRHSFLKDEICESIENMEDVKSRTTNVKAQKCLIGI